MSALALTVAALSSLFRDVLRLLQLGMVRTFLSEGESRDVSGGVSPDSGTGVLLSSEERREVLSQIEGGGARLEEAAATPAGGSHIACDGGAAACRLAVSEGTR